MDQDEAYRRVWQTFRTFKNLADGRHDTPDWRSHGGVYAVFVVRVPAQALQPALHRCRAALGEHPFVRVHPDHFLHIPLQELGFVCEAPHRADEISAARLEELATAAASPIGDHAQFDVSLGGVNSFQDATFLDVHDDGHCTRLHTRLFELAAIPRSTRYAYLPHATIAHYTAEAPIDGLTASLAPWRDISFGQFHVAEIELVTLRLDESYPALEPYAIVPLKR